MFYATRDERTAASIDDLDNVPFAALNFESLSGYSLFEFIDQNPGQSVKASFGGLEITFMPGVYTKFIFKHLDGERSLGEIFELVRNEATLCGACPSDDVLLEDFRPVYQLLNRHDGILLRHKSIGRFRPLGELQSWVTRRYRG